MFRQHSDSAPRPPHAAAALDIWCGQFNIVSGRIQEEGPFIGIFEGQAPRGRGQRLRRRGAGREPRRRDCATRCSPSLPALRGAGTALTDNLLRALNAANQHVRDWNRIHGDDGGVGVFRLAVRDDEAYLAQCGAALAITHTAGRFAWRCPAATRAAGRWAWASARRRSSIACPSPPTTYCS
ncbi:MAG: hypothetical protein U0531_06775 [Dehalococcoidia bacterium]